MLFNTLALVPLMERFEADHGTLLSAAFFVGRRDDTLFAEQVVDRDSVWVFVLLGHEAIKTWKQNPWFSLSTYRIPTWTTPLLLLIAVTALVPNTSFLGHSCALAVGYAYGLGYLRLLAPPERILRWIEGKLNLLGRLPHYVSVDQKTYGRYGVLPTPNSAPPNVESSPMNFLGSGQRLGP
ncbi:MAG: hypothetical protein LQ340_004819 [Diploschistes diacapsis]|nr:MAG: hypothetical protein LQ340_004819 [Diploschistes diacapsis]